MINCICVVHTRGHEVIVGRFELRGVYAPAYGFVIVQEKGERHVPWGECVSILAVGAKVSGREIVVEASTNLPQERPSGRANTRGVA